MEDSVQKVPAYLTCSGFASGLTGTIGVQVINKKTGAVAIARTTSGISENPSGSGCYIATVTAPVKGWYQIVWDSGSISPSTVATDDWAVKGWLPN